MKCSVYFPARKRYHQLDILGSEGEVHDMINMSTDQKWVKKFGPKF